MGELTNLEGHPFAGDGGCSLARLPTMPKQKTTIAGAAKLLKAASKSGKGGGGGGGGADMESKSLNRGLGAAKAAKQAYGEGIEGHARPGALHDNFPQVRRRLAHFREGRD